jgi:hypothetical protein
MGHETTTEDDASLPEGERWLQLIGYGSLADQPTGYEIDGVPVLGRDFPLLCGDRLRPFFAGIEALDAQDPQRTAGIALARRWLEGYLPTDSG